MRKTLTALSLLSGFAVITLAEEAMPPALYFDSNGIGTDIAASLSQRPSFGVGRINSGDEGFSLSYNTINQEESKHSHFQEKHSH